MRNDRETSLSGLGEQGAHAIFDVANWLDKRVKKKEIRVIKRKTGIRGSTLKYYDKKFKLTITIYCRDPNGGVIEIKGKDIKAFKRAIIKNVKPEDGDSIGIRGGVIWIKGW